MSPDIRVPISLELVDKLCGSLTYTCTHKFDIKLYSSMYLMAFFGFLRVGEIAVSNGNYDNLLTINSVQFNHTGKSVLVSFVKYKHSKGRIHTLSISARSHNCPVQALREYIILRGTSPGYLYLDQLGKPITRTKFDVQLKKCLRFLRLDPTLYTTHCFRIGAATHAAASGVSDAKIRHMGRWHSDAFKKYIRFSPSVSE